jgi:hypothetical protein
MPKKKLVALLGVLGACLVTGHDARAFCGFYVSGADTKLFNDATQVVLMRDGTRTVLSMQNTYKGPPQNFAMVVPVPVVLQKTNVKTLDKALFAKLDRQSAPRLVEYWEQDPCAPIVEEEVFASAGAANAPMAKSGVEKKDLGVKIEAQFVVGEYEVVVLSAQDAAGLDTWLKREKYKIPDGAEPYLRPYVQSGSKFFVARVDVTKVKFDGDGRIDLSPLRFHYDSNELALPVRLGLINSAGTQDLIIHVLAQGQRYEPANYPSVTIPTNLDVTSGAKEHFGSFYAAVFDRTLEKHPKAIVTEYSWDAGTCDPCPGPTLTGGDIAALGADAISLAGSAHPGKSPGGRFGSGWVVTRLHARYSKDSLGADIVFKAAPPIAGGREMMGANGQLEHGSMSSPVNNFQGRYAIRHAWTGPITCNEPRRGVWGGPPPGHEQVDAASTSPIAATRIAFAARGAPLAQMITQDVPELDVKPSGAKDPPPSPDRTPPPTGAKVPEAPKRSGCAGCVAAPTSPDVMGGGGLFMGVLLALGRIRRKARAESR